MKTRSNNMSEFKHSECLFLDDTGAEMWFYMRPCEMKAKIRPLVEHGGGQVSSKLMPNAIKLAEPSSKQVGYFSTDFIFDSVKENKCQILDNYRRSRNGRMKYTPEEDNLIIMYVKKHATSSTSLSGNIFWKCMEDEKITRHTWQSLRDHYLKILRPKKDVKYKSLFETNKGSSMQAKGVVTISEALKSPKKGTVNKSTSKVARYNAEERQGSSVNSADSDGESDREEIQATFDSDPSAEFDAFLCRLAEKEGKASLLDKDDLNNSCESCGCEVTSSQDTKKPTNEHKKDPHSDLKTHDVLPQCSSPRKKGKSPTLTGDGARQHPVTQAKTSKRKILTDEATVSTTPTKQRRQSPRASVNAVPTGQTPSVNPVFWSQFKKLQDMTIDLKISNSLLKHALFVASGSVPRAKHYLLHGELEEGMEPWSVEEDEIILSKDADAIRKFKRERGRRELLERVLFLKQVKFN